MTKAVTNINKTVAKQNPLSYLTSFILQTAFCKTLTNLRYK